MEIKELISKEKIEKRIEELANEISKDYEGKDIEREYLSYAWRTKRSGEVLDEPQDGQDHAVDSIRYAVDDLQRPRFDF